MNRHFKTALTAAAFILGATLATSSHATAYKCTEDSGKTVYSDIPCAKKPAAKPAAATAAAAPAAVAQQLTKLTEADVVRALSTNLEYVHTNNQVELCKLYATDMTYSTEFQGPKPKKVFGGHDEACKQASDSAELARRAGVIRQIDRGATKVTIEPGELRAVAVYETSNRLTRYDRILETYRCNAKDQYVLLGGKILLAASEEVCKP